MKKILSILLLLAMCLSLFAACGDKEGEKPQESTPASDLNSAIDYLTSMYQTSGKDKPMDISSDKEVLSKVSIGGVGYPVTWTVKVTQGEADAASVSTEGGKTVIVVKPATTDSLFTATATVSDSAGKTASVDFNFRIPGAYVGTDTASMEEIVKKAYALADGEVLDKPATLVGKIIRIKSPYDDGYKNMTVSIAVTGREDKPLQCYRLTGEGADTLKAGDTITVTGYIVNYKGTVQFDQGCTVSDIVPGEGEIPVAPEDPKQIVKEAFALAEGESLPYISTLTGVITEIESPYSEQYKNITVVMKVEGKEITCYRLSGTGADSLMVNDTVTVTGYIKNHYGTIEFDFGCTLDNVVKGEGNPETIVKPSTPGGIVDAAYALGKDEALPYEATLTGKIVSVDEVYNAEYSNITVTIAVSGKESKPIKCYHLKGEGADKLAVGDTITVTGKIKNYNGTVEFDAPSLDAVTSGGGKPIVVPTKPADIISAAFALAEGESLPYKSTLTGKVTKVNSPYSAEFENVTVTIVVDGFADKPIECYRMKGDAASKVDVGDTITVTGTLKNYQGKVEFDAGCTLDKRVANPNKAPTDPKEIVNAAYALAPGASLPYTCTLTGTIVSVDKAYDSTYKNITVTIVIEGCEDKPIVCYRLKGDDAANLKVGDTISVKGQIKNYVKNDDSTIEFDSGCVLV